MIIRSWRPSDTEMLKTITMEAFTGVAIDYWIEYDVGPLGDGWQARKARQIENDIAANPRGVLVAEQEDGTIVGYITTRLDSESGIGWIPNLAVDRAFRGRGLGRHLLQAALDYLRASGMTHAKIETLTVNAAGTSLYPSLGFHEVARQIHYIMPLDPASPEA